MSATDLLLLAGLGAAGVPVAAMGLTLLLGAPLSERTSQHSAQAQAAILFALGATLVAAFLRGNGAPHELRLPALFEAHGYAWTPVLLVDRLSLAYAALVALVHPVIVRFSIPAFHREPGAQRYWFLVSLLALALWLVSLAGSIEVLFVGWELVGVCSVSLIAFFRRNLRSTENSLRALVYYRVCDAALLFACVWMHHALPSTEFQQFDAASSAVAASAIGLLLLFGSLAKSAQFPMSPWLHRAMEGPAASSAIFYGALSVHLGPWLLLRTEPLWGDYVVVRCACAGVGVVSAIYATLVGRTRPDAKTALAYATMAQLGVIYVEVALGFERLALVHLWAHAGLRTWQFLRSSSLIQDFQASPLVGADVRLKTRRGPWQRWLSAALERRLYLAAVRQFWLDALQWRLFARPLLAMFERVERWEERVLSARRGAPQPSSAGALALGAALAVPLWTLHERAHLVVAWLAFGAWTVWRSRRQASARWPRLALVGGALGSVVLLAPDLPQWALGLCLAVGAGVAPAHLWLESLRRSLARSEFALVLIAQPFVALMHGFLHTHPQALSPETLVVLQRVFVASAMIQGGLALVRRSPERVLGALIQSQSALVIAGAAAGPTGWDAAQMLLVSTMGSGLVLLTIASELRRRFGALDAASHHALADSAPILHRLFVVCGWIFVGLPGGVACFAEDLLFHAFVGQSVGATVGFVLAAGLNALAFYRVYLGVFTGPPVQPSYAPSATARWKIVGLSLGVLALLALGLAPALLAGAH